MAKRGTNSKMCLSRAVVQTIVYRYAASRKKSKKPDRHTLPDSCIHNSINDE